MVFPQESLAYTNIKALHQRNYVSTLTVGSVIPLTNPVEESINDFVDHSPCFHFIKEERLLSCSNKRELGTKRFDENLQINSANDRKGLST